MDIPYLSRDVCRPTEAAIRCYSATFNGAKATALLSGRVLLQLQGSTHTGQQAAEAQRPRLRVENGVLVILANAQTKEGGDACQRCDAHHTEGLVIRLGKNMQKKLWTLHGAFPGIPSGCYALPANVGGPAAVAAQATKCVPNLLAGWAPFASGTLPVRPNGRRHGIAVRGHIGKQWVGFNFGWCLCWHYIRAIANRAAKQPGWFARLQHALATFAT